jgi:hypothetical protein
MLLGFRLLQAQNIWLVLLYKWYEKFFRVYGPNTVHVPGNEFHTHYCTGGYSIAKDEVDLMLVGHGGVYMVKLAFLGIAVAVGVSVVPPDKLNDMLPGTRDFFFGWAEGLFMVTVQGLRAVVQLVV